MGINEVLKSQGIESQWQSTLLDPWGVLADKFISGAVNQFAAQQELDNFAAIGREYKDFRDEAMYRYIYRKKDPALVAQYEEEQRQKEIAKEAARVRVPAQSRKLNQAYQLAINTATKTPIAQIPTPTKVVTRTTEQQVADRELQQKIKTLKAQLQPAVTTNTRTSRALPPSVTLQGKGKLLSRVMNEFNMDKKEARRYLKKHGSD